MSFEVREIERTYNELLKSAIEGSNSVYKNEWHSNRQTRSGEVSSKFNHNLELARRETSYTHELDNPLPIISSKKIHFDNVLGELLWFLSGSTKLSDLRKFSNKSEEAWTIWTNDAKRFTGEENPEELGEIYGKNWRDFGGSVDQIANLIDGIKNDPYGRRHMVSALNPSTLDKAALPPCHTFFQCYVTEDRKLDFYWYQRSADVFLGLPYNITSYAALQNMLCYLTGLNIGKLSATLGDVHLYNNHLKPARQQHYNYLKEVCVLQNRSFCREVHFPLSLASETPKLVLPAGFNEESLLSGAYTCKDFELKGYNHLGEIKAPLSVG